MKKTYSQILDQIESLRKQAEAVKHKEISGVITRIKEAIAFYGLSAADLGLTGRAPKAQAAKPGKRRGRKPGRPAKAPVDSTPKFQDDQGNTWVGRGPRPKWLREALAAGRALSDFAIQK